MSYRTWTGAASDNNFGTAGNWQEGSVPVTGDNVVIRNSSANITAGLNQSSVTLASLTIDQTYTGLIGTGTAYLQIGATSVLIGSSSGNASQSLAGSGRIMLDFGSVVTTVTVLNSASRGSDGGLEPIRLLGTNTGNVLYVQGGRVGVGTTFASEVPELSAVTVSGSGTLDIGNGATVTTATVTAGTLNTQAGIGTLNQSGGTVNVQGAVTVGTCNLYTGASFNSVNGSPTAITFTNGIRLNECGLENVTINLGQSYKISVAA